MDIIKLQKKLYFMTKKNNSSLNLLVSKRCRVYEEYWHVKAVGMKTLNFIHRLMVKDMRTTPSGYCLLEEVRPKLRQ